MLADRLDDLHAATAAPITARRPWLSTWLSCFPQYQPVAVAVERADGRLDAVALLARSRRLGVTHVFGMGHGPSDQLRLPARNAAAAEELSRGLVDYLRTLPRPWRLLLRHLPQDDAVAALVASRLRHASLPLGDVSPVTRFTADRRLRTYVSRNHHQQVRRMLNRIDRDGLKADIAVLTDPREVAPLVDEVQEVSRDRDLELRGWSGLEDGSRGPFFRRVILQHAERREVVLTTLRLDEQLAAYVLCFRDGRAHRMWSCRVAPRWKRYGAGRLANNAALEHALADDGCDEFDWMRGDEPYKRSMANDVELARDLMAWSSAAVGRAADARRRLKVLVKTAAERHDTVARALPYAQTLGRPGALVRRRRASRT